jgi:2-amino-4-hydroxy-6-hydroxymethyldihydropteridine diphosphokinase
MFDGRDTTIAWLGLGSNLGERVVNLTRAALELSILPMSSLLAASSVYRSVPVGVGFSGEFYNAAVCLLTALPADELLENCLRIEQELGRDRNFLDRTIDIDLLLYGTAVINAPHLVVPHPRLLYRRFVLAPLVEMAPELMHPVFEQPMRAMLEALGEDQPVERLDQPLLPAWGC